MIDLPTIHPQTITAGPPVVYNDIGVWYFVNFFCTHKPVVEEAGHSCDNADDGEGNSKVL